MTWYCKEVPDGRREAEDSSGARTAQRIFMVYADNDETLDTPLLVRDKFGVTAANGIQLPSYAYAFLDNASLLASHPEIESIDPVARLWRVIWNYKSLSFGEKNPEDVGYLEWGADGEISFRDKWRAGYAMPPSSYPSGSVPASIEATTGGDPIDTAGEPLSSPHVTARITINEVIGTPPNWAGYRDAIGKRNSVEFGGYPAGMLLYLVPGVTKIGAGKYRIEHRFAFDQDYHLIQVAKKTADGKYILGTQESPPGTVLKIYAANTYWVQPFQLTTNFYAISPNFVGFA